MSLPKNVVEKLPNDLVELIENGKESRSSTHDRLFKRRELRFFFENAAFIDGHTVEALYMTLHLNYIHTYVYHNLVYGSSKIFQERQQISFTNDHEELYIGQQKRKIEECKDSHKRAKIISSSMSAIMSTKSYDLCEKTDGAAAVVDEPIETLSAQQQTVVDYIEAFMRGEECPQILCLIGPAGTGKTSTLKRVRQHAILYLASTNILTTAVGKDIGVKTMTTFSFIMRAFNMSYFEYDVLRDFLSYLDDDIFGDIEKTDICDKVCEVLASFPPDDGLVIYLDEISQMTNGEMSLFLLIVRSLPRRVLVLLAGDMNQIHPLYVSSPFAIENIKNESKVSIAFDVQFRMTEPAYKKFTESVITEHPRQLIDCLKTSIPDKINKPIVYRYPYYLFEKLHLIVNFGDMDSVVEFAGSLRESGVFEKVIDFVLFGFTNREMHYNVMMVALQVYETLDKLGVEPSLFLQYSPIKVGNIGMRDRDHLEDFKSDTNGLQDYHFFPLIRYFPYKLLQKVVSGDTTFPNLYILYLIHWDNEYCLMYDDSRHKLLKLRRQPHTRHLWREMRCFGFPIYPAFTTTFHSCQGLTLKKRLAINLTNIDRKEMYVVFSRVKKFDCIHSILI